MIGYVDESFKELIKKALQLESLYPMYKDCPEPIKQGNIMEAYALNVVLILLSSPSTKEKGKDIAI